MYRVRAQLDIEFPVDASDFKELERKAMEQIHRLGVNDFEWRIKAIDPGSVPVRGKPGDGFVGVHV